MAREFERYNSLIYLTMEWRRIQQRPDETVNAYWKRFQDLMGRINTRQQQALTPEDVKITFYHGLKHTISDGVHLDQQPIGQMVEKAQQAECKQSTRQQNKDSFLISDYEHRHDVQAIQPQYYNSNNQTNEQLKTEIRELKQMHLAETGIHREVRKY